MDRREFLQSFWSAGTGSLLGAPASPVLVANEKVRFACIGVGGKGDSDTNDAGGHGEIVALCDIDANVLDKMGTKYPKAKKYYRLPQDARGTRRQDRRGDRQHARPHPRPGQRHGHADGQALLLPEAADLVDRGSPADADARRREEALHPDGQPGHRRGRVPLGRRADPLRRARADQGDPRLDQSPDLAAGHRAGPRTHPAFPTTSAGTSSWAPPPTGRIIPITSRSTGAAGSISAPAPWATWPATRSTSPAWRSSCSIPRSVEVVDTSGIVDHETYPVWSIIRTQFGPRNGRGPADLTWYDGGDKFPERQEGLTRNCLYGEKVPDSGLLLVGEKGSFFSAERLRRGARAPAPGQVQGRREAQADPAALAGPLHRVRRRHQGRRSDQGDVELRLRRPADRDRAPGRRRAQDRHEDRVGSRRPSRPGTVPPPISTSAATIARDSRSTERSRR